MRTRYGGMKKAIFAITIAIIVQPAFAVPCNKAAAQDIQFGIREFAKWGIEGDHLAVHWVYAIDKLPAMERLKMVTVYADMDACLRGSAFEIVFYRKGKIMGIASPTSGIRLVK